MRLFLQLTSGVAVVSAVLWFLHVAWGLIGSPSDVNMIVGFAMIVVVITAVAALILGEGK